MNDFIIIEEKISFRKILCNFILVLFAAGAFVLVGIRIGVYIENNDGQGVGYAIFLLPFSWFSVGMLIIIQVMYNLVKDSLAQRHAELFLKILWWNFVFSIILWLMVGMVAVSKTL